MRLQRLDDHRKMPWKNGLGVTREVAVHAPPENPSAFLWRISLATVSGSGPFSAFPGIDRTIAVLSGEGMRLTVDGTEQAPLTVDCEPYAFSGDAEVHADSLGAETTDLNIMTRRGRFRHGVRRVVIDKDTVIAMPPDVAALVFGGEAVGRFGDRTMAFGSGDVLLDIDPAGSPTFTATSRPVAVFVVSIVSCG